MTSVLSRTRRLAARLLTGSVLTGGFLAIGMGDNLSQAHNLAAQGIANAIEGGSRLVERATAAPDPSPYRTAAVERGSMEQTIAATGPLEPVKTTDVGSTLPGEVSHLFVDFNDAVRQGQPLAQVDARTFQAKVDRERAGLKVAEAAVRIATAKLERARIDLAGARTSREVLTAKLDDARALAAAARSSFERQKVLKAQNITPLSAYEQAEADAASKGAGLRQSTATLGLHDMTVAGAEADVRRLEAELAQAQADVPAHAAALRIAEIDLERTVIRAPTDGVIVGRFINEGQTIAEGLEARPVFTVAMNLASMEIHARVDESDIGRIRPGQRADFTVDAFPSRHFAAVVRQVRKAPEVTQNVVTYTVVLATDNRDGALLPGMTALARIVVARDDGVLKVPAAAVRFQPRTMPDSPRTSGAGVWVAAGGSIRRVPVTTGPASGDQVAVAAGSLGERDRVVVGEAEPPPGRRLFGLRLDF